MASSRSRATADLWRKITGIVILTGLMLIGSIGYVGATGQLDFNMIVPVVGVVACAALLLCGLVAFAYVSDRSRDA